MEESRDKVTHDYAVDESKEEAQMLWTRSDRTAWSAKNLITAWFLFLTLFNVIAASRPVNDLL